MHKYNYDTKDVNKMDDLAYAEAMGWINNSDYDKLEMARKKLPHWHEHMENPKHPSHVQPRADSIIDLNFKRTREEKITALIAMARMSNSLGKTFNLKYNYSFAIPHLEAARVRFRVEGLPSLVH
jgi:hypothetical protein